MRASAFPAALSIGTGFAIAFLAAILRAAFAGPEPQTGIAVGDPAQFQKFAQWRDRRGVTGDTCLSEPDGPAEPGTRWHFHLDAATQRHCWYQKRLDAIPAAAAKAPRQKRREAAPVPAAKVSRAQAADSSRSKKHAHPLPLTAAERDTLFRQFQQWREQQP